MAAGYGRGQGDEVRKGGSTGNGRCVGAGTTQAKRAGPDQGLAARLDAQHDSATGHFPWPGMRKSSFIRDAQVKSKENSQSRYAYYLVVQSTSAKVLGRV